MLQQYKCKSETALNKQYLFSTTSATVFTKRLSTSNCISLFHYTGPNIGETKKGKMGEKKTNGKDGNED